MNKGQLKENDQLGQWVKESGHESPSINFSENIINTLAQQKVKTAYQPVIPPFGLGMIILMIVSISVYVLLFLPNEGTNEFWSVRNIQFSKIPFSDLFSFLPSLSSNLILNLSLLAFSIFAFISALFWSKRIYSA